jgi:lipopolysaccharide export system permease protein
MLRTYVGPFIATFFIAWFVLIMQFLWKYIDDILGKSIETYLLLKFLWYTSATFVPMALPIAILLTSIMTYGNMGENSELTAIKASGISLIRSFKALIFFSVFIAILAFYFSNNVLTKATYVSRNMLAEIRNLKPALFLKPKTFNNSISGFTIWLEDKNEQTDELFNIILYAHNNDRSNNQVLFAKRAIINYSKDGKYLVMQLDSGLQLIEEASNRYSNIKFPHYRISFLRWTKFFDLTQFQLKEASENFSERQYRLNVKELKHEIDSFQINLKQEFLKFDSTQALNTMPNFTYVQANNTQIDSVYTDSISVSQIALNALNRAREMRNLSFDRIAQINYNKGIINMYLVEYYRKFTLSIASIILFFVGAPLGSIIRKGGLGWPMLFAVIFFMLYLALVMSGERIAIQGIASAFIGMWLATIVFIPIGIFLTYQAMNDSAMFSLSDLNIYFKQFFARWTKK